MRGSIVVNYWWNNQCDKIDLCVFNFEESFFRLLIVEQSNQVFITVCKSGDQMFLNWTINELINLCCVPFQRIDLSIIEDEMMEWDWVMGRGGRSLWIVWLINKCNKFDLCAFDFEESIYRLLKMEYLNGGERDPILVNC